MSADQITTSSSTGNGIGGTLGMVIGLAVFLVVLNAAAWFFSAKSTVYVLDEVNGRLQVTKQWLYVEDEFLLGMPSMVARWFGWQAPKAIDNHGGKIPLGGLIKEAKPELMIAVNRTRGDLFHKPVVYGDSKKVPAYTKLEITRIPPGQAMALMDAWGFKPYVGCRDKPKARTSSSTSKANYFILAWLTEKHPSGCM